MAAAAVVLRSPPAVAAAVVWRGRRAVSRLFAAAAGLRGRSGGRPPFRREGGPRPRRWGRSRGGEARVGLCRSLPLPNPPPPGLGAAPARPLRDLRPLPPGSCGSGPAGRRRRPAAEAPRGRRRGGGRGGAREEERGEEIGRRGGGLSAVRPVGPSLSPRARRYWRSRKAPPSLGLAGGEGGGLLGKQERN